MMKTGLITLLTCMNLSAGAAWASELTPTTLAPLTHNEASLVVLSPDGTENVYSPSELEAFTTYSLNTTTPWRDEPAVFEGVRLADILSANGLAEIDRILVTAENDYSTTIDIADLDRVDVLVATRVDGRPHRKRERGPIQFVIGDADFAQSGIESQSIFVWMAARIEPAD